MKLVDLDLIIQSWAEKKFGRNLKNVNTYGIPRKIDGVKFTQGDTHYEEDVLTGNRIPLRRDHIVYDLKSLTGSVPHPPPQEVRTTVNYTFSLGLQYRHQQDCKFSIELPLHISAGVGLSRDSCSTQEQSCKREVATTVIFGDSSLHYTCLPGRIYDVTYNVDEIEHKTPFVIDIIIEGNVVVRLSQKVISASLEGTLSRGDKPHHKHYFPIETVISEAQQWGIDTTNFCMKDSRLCFEQRGYYKWGAFEIKFTANESVLALTRPPHDRPARYRHDTTGSTRGDIRGVREQFAKLSVQHSHTANYSIGLEETIQNLYTQVSWFSREIQYVDFDSDVSSTLDRARAKETCFFIEADRETSQLIVRHVDALPSLKIIRTIQTSNSEVVFPHEELRKLKHSARLLRLPRAIVDEPDSIGSRVKTTRRSGLFFQPKPDLKEMLERIRIPSRRPRPSDPDISLPDAPIFKTPKL